jgi:hypothetical protein
MESDRYTLTLPAESGTAYLLPSFTHSVSLASARRPPVPVRAREAVQEILRRGGTTTVQTLYNMEKRGQLTSDRRGPRLVYYDLNEVLDRFHLL